MIRNMVSRMSLTAAKTSPTLAVSPTSGRAPEPSFHDIGSPSSRAETLSVKKRRFAFDGITKGETRNRDLHGIAEEPLQSPADDIATKLSTANTAGSISKRRGYRPLSVRIGEAFNPFSPRESKPNLVPLTHSNMMDSIEDASQDLSRSTELSDHVNWSANQNPHLFNANFIATLTSKCESASAHTFLRAFS